MHAEATCSTSSASSVLHSIKIESCAVAMISMPFSASRSTATRNMSEPVAWRRKFLAVRIFVAEPGL